MDPLDGASSALQQPTIAGIPLPIIKLHARIAMRQCLRLWASPFEFLKTFFVLWSSEGIAGPVRMFRYQSGARSHTNKSLKVNLCYLSKRVSYLCVLYLCAGNAGCQIFAYICWIHVKWLYLSSQCG